MKLVPLESLFEVKYGVNKDFNKLKKSNNGINYVSRSGLNNGVVGKVELLEGCEPNPGGTISVSCGGSVLASFVQVEPYYSGRDLYYLVPLEEMTKQEMLYYCICIKNNKFKYNFGRQPNKTLNKLKVPCKSEMPEFIKNTNIKDISNFSEKFSNEDTEDLDTPNWKIFRYSEVFEIERGSSSYKKYMNTGCYPYASASDNTNGVTGYVDEYNREGNLIVLNYDGSVASAFYQPSKFFASEKVVTLSLIDYELNKYIALFLTTVIRLEKFRYNYGRKWSVEKRMKDSIIKLPAKIKEVIKIEDKEGKYIDEIIYEPNYEFMEKYIKSLHFSKEL